MDLLMGEKMYWFSISFIFLTLISCGQENPHDWAFCSEGNGNNINSCTTTQQIGSSYLDFGKDISIYSSDSIYIVGHSEGNLDGNNNSGGADFFLIKYNSLGWKQWSSMLGSTQNDYAQGSDVDSNDNIYVAGFTQGDLDSKSSNGNDDLFLSKYNSSGVKQWTETLGTAQDDQAKDVAVHSSSFAYVTGQTMGDITGDNAGNNDIFLLKYNASGNLQWRIQKGSSYDDVSKGVDTDSAGNIYITGYTEGDLTGDSSGDADFFLAKYNSSGVVQWLIQLDTTSDSYGQSIAIDSSNNIYVTGHTEGSFDGNANIGGSDIFLVKYNSSGDKQWSIQTGSTGNEYGKGVSVDSSGNIYITGYVSSALDGNSNLGGNDSFVMKFDTSGTKEWTTQTGSAYNDYANSMAINSNGDLFVTGATDGGLDGNVNSGGTDIFLFKLNSSGTKL